jgi:MFS family permease
MAGIRGLFGNRIFLLFWIGEVISVFGDQFYLLALPWITLQLTHSPAALGTVLMAAAIPRAVLMPLGGVLVDRWSPQGVLLVSNAARAVVVTVVTGLLLRDAMQLWHIYALSVAFGAVDALSFPAFMSLTPRLVDDRRLEAANAVVQGTAQVAAMIGPAIAGVVIASLGVAFALGIDAVSFWISVVTLSIVIRMVRQRSAAAAAISQMPEAVSVPPILVPAPISATVTSLEPKPAGGLGEAVRYVLRDPVLRTVLVILAAINFGVLGPIGVGLPALVTGPLGGGATLLGVVMGTFGAGTLTGMLTAALRKRPERPGPATSWACGLLSLGVGAVAVAAMVPQLLVVLVATLFVAGAALGYLNVQGISWLQARVPQSMMGRVMAIMVLSGNGLGPISYALSGQVAGHSLPALFLGGGLAVGLSYAATRGAAFRRVSMVETLPV